MNIGIEEARPPYVVFETRAEEDRQASIEAGQVVYKNVDYAIITPQGSRDRIERVAEEWLKKIQEDSQGYDPRFPPQWVRHYRDAYQAFKDEKEAPVLGTALRDWPAITPAQIKNLATLHVRSVEDIAGANEETLQRIGMGARDLQNRARNWLRAAEGPGKLAEEVSSLQSANAGLKARNEELSSQLSQLAQRLSFLEANGGTAIQQSQPLPKFDEDGDPTFN